MRSVHIFIGLALLASVASPPCALADWDVRDGLPVWRPAPPGGPHPQAADDPYEAAQLGINWLNAAVCNWMNTTAMNVDCTDNSVKPCFGCHAQAEAALGLARSAARCYSIPSTPCEEPGDENRVEYVTRYLAGTQRKDCILGTPSVDCALSGMPADDLSTRDMQPPDLGAIGHYPPCGSQAPPASRHIVIQTAHGALNLAGYTRYVSPKYAQNLLALCDWMVTRQAGTGEWVPDRFEAPVDQGASFCTGAAIMAMAAAMPHANAAQQTTYQASMDQAIAWVESATHSTTQDKSMALLGLLEAGRPVTDPAVENLKQVLIDDQLADGGWAERTGLQSNAYGTGQALFALMETDLDLNDPTVCAGVQWLVDNQNPDGSWDLGTVGVNTDSGRNSQFTASMWPVMALGSLNPFGAALDLGADNIETCEDVVQVPITVRHAGDSPCGLFAEPDTYDLEVFNDSGDLVTINPTSVDLTAGDTTVVEVEWVRSGPLPPPGTTSLTTVRATSRGSVAAGCAVEEETEFSIVVPVDEVPVSIGSSLRLRRDGFRINFAWNALPETVGSYELVSAGCPAADDCTVSPGPPTLDSATPRTRAGRVAGDAWIDGDIGFGSDALIFYKVRASSLCLGAPGPTCDYDCTDPNVCYLGCP